MAETRVELDAARLARVRQILGTDTLRETLAAAFDVATRVAAARELVCAAEEGAFAALLEPGAEERMWG